MTKTTWIRCSNQN